MWNVKWAKMLLWVDSGVHPRQKSSKRKEINKSENFQKKNQNPQSILHQIKMFLPMIFNLLSVSLIFLWTFFSLALNVILFWLSLFDLIVYVSLFGHVMLTFLSTPWNQILKMEYSSNSHDHLNIKQPGTWKNTALNYSCFTIELQ